jgi:hypothetical protein
VNISVHVGQRRHNVRVIQEELANHYLCGTSTVEQRNFWGLPPLVHGRIYLHSTDGQRHFQWKNPALAPAPAPATSVPGLNLSDLNLSPGTLAALQNRETGQRPLPQKRPFLEVQASMQQPSKRPNFSTNSSASDALKQVNSVGDSLSSTVPPSAPASDFHISNRMTFDAAHQVQHGESKSIGLDSWEFPSTICQVANLHPSTPAGVAVGDTKSD